VKKSDAAAATESNAESNAESSANATVVVIESTPAAETKTKKAPRAKKVAADKPADTVVVIESPAASAESSDVTVTVAETVAASSASEPKAKKAPRAKKVTAPADGSESDVSVTAAASASEPKAKKTAAPRAKKADKPDVASDTVASDEQKAKKAPRAKKAAAEKPAAVVAEEAAAEVVVQAAAAAAIAVTAVVETPIDEESDSQYEEVEIEVVEFTFDGVKYLRSKNEDNTVYDPETSDVVGIWNEANGCIDAE
jgi:hypothetical protein